VARSKPTNPLYVLVALVGVVFSLTACSYGVMAYRRLHASPSEPFESGLLNLLERRGMAILAVELAVLAVVSVAAMGSDPYWANRYSDRTDRDFGGDAREADTP